MGRQGSMPFGSRTTGINACVIKAPPYIFLFGYPRWLQIALLSSTVHLFFLSVHRQTQVQGAVCDAKHLEADMTEGLPLCLPFFMLTYPVFLLHLQFILRLGPCSIPSGGIE